MSTLVCCDSPLAGTKTRFHSRNQSFASEAGSIGSLNTRVVNSVDTVDYNHNTLAFTEEPRESPMSSLSSSTENDSTQWGSILKSLKLYVASKFVSDINLGGMNTAESDNDTVNSEIRKKTHKRVKTGVKVLKSLKKRPNSMQEVVKQVQSKWNKKRRKNASDDVWPRAKGMTHIKPKPSNMEKARIERSTTRLRAQSQSLTASQREDANTYQGYLQQYNKKNNKRGIQPADINDNATDLWISSMDPGLGMISTLTSRESSLVKATAAPPPPSPQEKEQLEQKQGRKVKAKAKAKARSKQRDSVKSESSFYSQCYESARNDFVRKRVKSRDEMVDNLRRIEKEKLSKMAAMSPVKRGIGVGGGVTTVVSPEMSLMSSSNTINSLQTRSPAVVRNDSENDGSNEYELVPYGNVEIVCTPGTAAAVRAAASKENARKLNGGMVGVLHTRHNSRISVFSGYSHDSSNSNDKVRTSVIDSGESHITTLSRVSGALTSQGKDLHLNHENRSNRSGKLNNTNSEDGMSKDRSTEPLDDNTDSGESGMHSGTHSRRFSQSLYSNDSNSHFSSLNSITSHETDSSGSSSETSKTTPRASHIKTNKRNDGNERKQMGTLSTFGYVVKLFIFLFFFVLCFVLFIFAVGYAQQI